MWIVVLLLVALAAVDIYLNGGGPPQNGGTCSVNYGRRFRNQLLKEARKNGL